MYKSPETLEELCIETFCDQILKFIEPVYTSRNLQNFSEKDSSSDENSESDSDLQIKRYRFRDPDIFLINTVSEKVLKKLNEKKMLRDPILNIFTGENTMLKKVKLKNCDITKHGLAVLRDHNIVEIECITLKKICIGDVLDVFNEWTLMNITSASFPRCTFIDDSRHNSIVKLTTLKNLRNLNLAYTELTQSGLKMLCEDLQMLERLNISGTSVKSLKPLLLLSEKLISLSLSGLYKAENFAMTLSRLKFLQHLDVSLYVERPDFSRNSLFCPVIQLLENKTCLPHLVSLDLSGWKDLISKELVLNIIETHPKLKFLGLVLTDVCFADEFSSEENCTFPNLTIAGFGNHMQIKVALQMYQDRAYYIQKTLYHLFQSTNCLENARPDLFQLVLPVMEAYPKKFNIQLAATACLYNLTKGDLSKNIHPHYLKKGVTLTLDAMTIYPDEFQLQKNSLLTLCSDRILQEVNFDRFRCARLVLDSLCNFEDVNMNRMAVAICSILASKISTSETSELGARPSYMQRLLSLVSNRVESRVSDITLKFTLSALWNLTDESSATCKVFLEADGAQLFLQVLKTFPEDSSVQTKVLGLLNNIAEVADLRKSLMMESLIERLHSLLKSSNIDVSYFAAGIVAHLASDGESEWTVECYSRVEMLHEVESAVLLWKIPDSEMVAYRSFKPFFPLLQIHMDYQIQLWAVWAVHHVCTKNPSRYCCMLQEENGYFLLKELVSCETSHSLIKNMAFQILDIINNKI